MIIRNIPNGFLSKVELELILDVIFKFENAFAFTHTECGTFNMKYYPEYTMRMIPHVLWQIKPIRLPKSRSGSTHLQPHNTHFESQNTYFESQKYHVSVSEIPILILRTAVFEPQKYQF